MSYEKEEMSAKFVSCMLLFVFFFFFFMADKFNLGTCFDW